MSSCRATNANARLIAAAPTLLEALEGLMFIDDDPASHAPCGCSFCVALDAARAAIAAARGTT